MTVAEPTRNDDEPSTLVRDFTAALPPKVRRHLELDPMRLTAWVTTACTDHGWTPHTLADHVSRGVRDYWYGNSAHTLMCFRLRRAAHPEQPTIDDEQENNS